MVECPDIVKRLIERFNQQLDQVRSPDYNETELRVDYVNPMYAALGWDMDNSSGYAEQYRDVVHEDRVKVAGQTKAPDYSFRIGGARKFFLEAKKPFVNLKQAWEPAYQLRRYGWSAKLAVSILTDFEELAIYDCRVAPKQLDKPATARREYIGYLEYADRWDFIEGTFSKRAVLEGEFDRYCQTAKGRGRQEFDVTFLEEIEDWRKKLAGNLALRNDSLDEPALNFSVQRIIDRIIFLRIAEDRGTETIGQLQALLNGEKTYDRLKKLFRDADARYNSGLFHFEKEKDRDESPDTLTPTLDIDDATLKSIIRRLYYPESPYEFTVVSADILGSVYERFLGKVITLTPGHRAKIEEKPEVRKAGGVYYTPAYIVDYIVKNTVGKLLEGKSPKEAAKLKVLDPACGSGSFLIGAYQHLIDWHLAQYRASAPEKLAAGKAPVLRPGPDGDWRLTIAERKRILLDNIHGVDLDAAAVEVTKLNLLLKCLEGETGQTLGFNQRLFRDRALPDLGHNIACGNSLIGTDIVETDEWRVMSDEQKRGINPFDYRRAFKKIFNQGGFDAVIGNPPYVDVKELGDQMKELLSRRYRVATKRFDLFVPFIERGLSIARDSSFICFIVPSTFLTREYGAPVRELIVENKHLVGLVDFGTFQVFDSAQNYVCIPLLSKDSAALRFDVVQITSGISDRIEVMAALQGSQVAGVKRFKTDLSSLSGGTPWHITDERESKLFQRLSEGASPLSELLLFASEGIHSGKDEVFFLDRSKSKEIEGESPPCYPLARGRDIHRYEFPNQALLTTLVIYPYRADTGELIPADELRSIAPKTWRHLENSRGLLRGREYFDSSGKEWYELWCQRRRQIAQIQPV